MPRTSASARDRLTSSLVHGTAIATSIALGMVVTTTSVAADLSADSAAVTASAVAVALAGALAKSRQTLARVCGSIYCGSSFRGSIHRGSGFVASIATMMMATIAISMRFASNQNSSVHVRGRQWLAVSLEQAKNKYLLAKYRWRQRCQQRSLDTIHNFGNSDILRIFSKYCLRWSVRIHCIHRTSSGTSGIRPIRI